VVWDSPQAAALAWQEMVERDQLAARYSPESRAPYIPSLQTWSNGLPEPYGNLRQYYLRPGSDSDWDGYHHMGPGYSHLKRPSSTPGDPVPF
jgi:hypothetical protein